MSDLSRGDLSRREEFSRSKKRVEKASCRGSGEVTCKVEEIDARGTNTILVDLQRKATRILEVTTKTKRHPLTKCEATQLENNAF
jgi:tRNA A37 N6-isopentenylltransferase MiaA